MQVKERRNQPRVNIGLPTIVNVDQLVNVPTRTIDVSLGGALLDSPVPLMLGAVVQLKFNLEMSSLPTVQARVLRCTPAFWGRRYTLGLEFTEPTPALMDVVDLIYHLREGHARKKFRWLEDKKVVG